MSCPVPVIVGLFRGKQPWTFAFAGMGLAVFAVVLVSRESTHHHGRTPLSAIIMISFVIVVARSTRQRRSCWPAL